MIVAHVLTPWIVVQDYGENTNIAKLSYILMSQGITKRNGYTWTINNIGDTPYVPPDPNLLMVRLECGENVLPFVEADPEIIILWSEVL